jgi:2-dehydropantoate 2-reductase
MDWDKRIWVVGAGAVGSVMAALAVKAGLEEVRLVGASPHWRAVRGSGLSFEIQGQGQERLTLGAAAPAEVPALGPQDVVLLAGKLPDLPAVMAWLGPKLGAETALVALHNGLGVEAWLASLAGGRAAERGLVFFGAHSSAPGQATYFPGRLRFRRSPLTEALSQAFDGPLVKSQAVDDFAYWEWFKLAINCLANPLAGLLGANNVQLASPGLDQVKEAVLAEVKAVAAAEGVALNFTVADFNRAIPSDNVPSLRTDLVRGRPTEIDSLNGAVVARGQAHGLATPANALLVDLIKHLERQGLAPALPPGQQLP